MELIEASALQQAVKHTVVEDRMPYLNSFDVLLQYLTTLAISDGFYPKEIYQEIKQTFCYPRHHRSTMAMAFEFFSARKSEFTSLR